LKQFHFLALFRLQTFCIFLIILPVSIFASATSIYDSMLDQIAEDVFLSPRQKEITEIEKRVMEKNREEVASLRSSIKHLLHKNDHLKRIVKDETIAKLEFVHALEGIPNLGGLLWYRDSEVFFSWGDWSDYYEDGLSLAKLRNEGQLTYFQIENNRFYYFVKNSSGYFPVNFQFVGWETTFYVFGEDGSLRYTNDLNVDTAIRSSEFKKIFESIKRKVRHCEVREIGGLSVFLVPGEERPLYYVLFGLRIFIYIWAVYLSYLFLSQSFPFLKKQLQK
jgi:hypothetical protein